jgi:hypothetical protein
MLVSREGSEMDLSNLELIARAAEKACVAVINRPEDIHAREELFNALAAVVDPAFEGDDDTASPYQNDLLSKARVWADIVRSRIESVRATKGGDPSAPTVHYPARDLLQFLSELVGELARAPEA